MKRTLEQARLAQCISPAYRQMQRELHARPNGYGGKGHKWAPTVARLVAEHGYTSVLDYGCGQGALMAALRGMVPSVVRLEDYDPAIAGKDGHPGFADLVTCTDVLEHIEPDRLDAVLAHLRLLARKAVFFVVALDPANKTLSDGRNAHLIQESPDWWQACLVAAGFHLSDVEDENLPAHYTPEKRAKRWIVVGTPC